MSGEIFKYKSIVDNILRDVEKDEGKNRKKAAQHLVSKMREKVNKKGGASSPGQPPHRRSGNLKKGITYSDDIYTRTTKVGVGPPARHAHLMEFGTVERKNKKQNKSTGRVEARPFMRPTFSEEKDAVEKILSERYL